MSTQFGLLQARVLAHVVAHTCRLTFFLMNMETSCVLAGLGGREADLFGAPFPLGGLMIGGATIFPGRSLAGLGVFALDSNCPGSSLTALRLSGRTSRVDDDAADGFLPLSSKGSFLMEVFRCRAVAPEDEGALASDDKAFLDVGFRRWVWDEEAPLTTASEEALRFGARA